ncbi:MAG: acetyl-CoA carboxylase biotin carboxyl carrier protein subunit [Armatimonadetes bacterium]|nr:acetyl-CoA carboxylase biotin carboxyl carrier protein subunit [Armatimonadota bacterium]
MKLKISIDNKSYEVDVEVAETESPTAVRYVTSGGGRTAGPAAPTPSSNGSGGGEGKQPADEAKACRSPLAGVVSEVSVAVGDSVELDQSVLVLEAMKMFTTITSPVSGKVMSIEVAVGDSVKQGQLLIEFE